MNKSTRKTKAGRSKQAKKCLTGISGFDAITNGGLPRHSITLLSGGPGAGKTVFSLEFLMHGARDFGEPGLCVSFEESPDKLIANAASSGMDLKALVDAGTLHFFDARVSPDTITTGDFDIEGLLAMVEVYAKRIGAKRIVFDGLDILLSFMRQTAQRLEIWRLNRWLEDSDFTAIVTIKSNDGNDDPVPMQFGWIEYIPDVVVTLSQTIHSGVTERRLKVLKYRGSDHVHNACAAVISDDGFHIAQTDDGTPQIKPSTERIGTGVDRLDGMLEGGFLRGSGILVTGAPGTAKTSLASSFADATCRRGERVIYFAFDESGPEIVRNMASIGIDLAGHEKKGLLRFYSLHSHTLSPEESFIHFMRAVDKYNVDVIIIDPLSSIDSDMESVPLMVKRLLAAAKARNVTSLWTSLLDSTNSTREETSRAGASTCADTWVHLSYDVHVGERNRALTIVKSRGTAHSSQVSELVLSRDGIDLEEIYSSGGQMFMGTSKAERSFQDMMDEEVRRSEYNRQLRKVRSELESLNEAVRLKTEEQSILESREQARFMQIKEYEQGQQRLRGQEHAPDAPKKPVKRGRKSPQKKQT